MKVECTPAPQRRLRLRLCGLFFAFTVAAGCDSLSGPSQEELSAAIYSVETRVLQLQRELRQEESKLLGTVPQALEYCEYNEMAEARYGLLRSAEEVAALEARWADWSWTDPLTSVLLTSDGVRVDTLEFGGLGLQLEGRARGRTDFAAFFEALRQRGGFASVEVGALAPDLEATAGEEAAEPPPAQHRHRASLYRFHGPEHVYLGLDPSSGEDRLVFDRPRLDRGLFHGYTQVLRLEPGDLLGSERIPVRLDGECVVGAVEPEGSPGSELRLCPGTSPQDADDWTEGLTGELGSFTLSLSRASSEGAAELQWQAPPEQLARDTGICLSLAAASASSLEDPLLEELELGKVGGSQTRQALRERLAALEAREAGLQRGLRSLEQRGEIAQTILAEKARFQLRADELMQAMAHSRELRSFPRSPDIEAVLAGMEQALQSGVTELLRFEVLEKVEGPLTEVRVALRMRGDWSFLIGKLQGSTPSDARMTVGDFSFRAPGAHDGSAPPGSREVKAGELTLEATLSLWYRPAAPSRRR